MPTTTTPARPASTRRARSVKQAVLRFRMRVTDGESIAVGPGKIALLEALDRTGSISAAARSLDMSYRRAWVLLDEMNRALREPVVTTAKGGANGGGSVVTPAGHRVIELYRRIESKAALACRRDISELMSLLAR